MTCEFVNDHARTDSIYIRQRSLRCNESPVMNKCDHHSGCLNCSRTLGCLISTLESHHCLCKLIINRPIAINAHEQLSYIISSDIGLAMYR